ncbi:MAG: hypothetical protein ACI9LX_004517, partial [Paraglaciecola sp.]
MNDFTTPKDAYIADIKGLVQIELADSGAAPSTIKNGDRVPSGTVLTLNKGSEMSLAFDDGSQQRVALPLGEGEDGLVIDTIASEEQATAQFQVTNAATSGNELSDIEAIQALIASGDGDIDSPNTIAGGETGNEGTSTVTIARDGAELLAEAGVDSAPLEVALATVAEPETLDASTQPTLTQSDVNVVEEDTTASGNVLDNDSDLDDVLIIQSYTVLGDPNLYLSGQTATIEDGILTVNNDGSYTFIPADDWNGQLPVVNYLTNTNVTDTLSISVTPVNDVPFITIADTSVTEDVAVTATSTLSVTDALSMT